MPILYFGSGAACFGAGIILLANHLEPQDMGMVALFLVLLRLGPALGTIGLDVLLMRAQPVRDVLPFNAIAASSVAVSLLVVSLATVVYDLSLDLAVALSAGLIAASYWRSTSPSARAPPRAKRSNVTTTSTSRKRWTPLAIPSGEVGAPQVP